MKNISYDVQSSLKGKLLVASPSMSDNRFYKAVILITNHDEKGAVGVIINKNSAHKFVHIIKSIDANYDESRINLGDQQINIVLGGPVNSNSLFIIHSPDYKVRDTQKITDTIHMTNQLNILSDLANNNGPKKSIISIGCAMWKTNQIEQELFSDSWFISDLNENLVFDIQVNQMYDNVFSTLGFRSFENNSALFISNKLKS